MGGVFAMAKSCPLDLFRDFEFADITKVKPPDTRGVYVIQVRKAGIPANELIKKLIPHLSRLRWKMAQDHLLDRISRILNIADCPILYIGSAGTNPTSKGTLAGRYRDLTRNHPAQLPLLALLYFGWELDFGWKVTDNPRELEAELKNKYQTRGHQKIPALAMR
jgi:hypothetical protein